MKPRRPVLRYHGGKFALAPWILSHFPPHRVYVEPFGGAGSVLLQKPRSLAEVYNDLDQQVVNVFRVLRDAKRAERLRELCELTPWSRVEFVESYKPARDKVEAARRTILRSYMAHGATSRRANRTGFRAKNYRRNQAGPGDWSGWPSAIPAFTERLRGVTIECRPALEVIRQQDTPDTLFYCDPPYVLSTRSAVRWPSDRDRAYACDLDDEDHEELAAVLHGVAGMVLISGYPSRLYERLYSDWHRVTTTVKADGAAKRTECLWMNAACRARQPAPTLAFAEEQ